jgi:hypothetical protein
MNKKSWPAAWAFILCTVALVLVLWGGRWLWQLFLTMHGMH